MPQWHRFFFVFCLTFILPVIAICGITIVPLFCLVRTIFKKICKPNSPERPKSPKKPNKPSEPAIGASQEEWIQYRKNMENYRQIKKDWKNNVEQFKKQENKLMNAYYNERKDYKKKYEHEIDVVPEYWWEPIKDTTIHLIFCYSVKPKLLLWFIQKYSNEL